MTPTPSAERGSVDRGLGTAGQHRSPELGRAPHPRPSILEVMGTRIQVQLTSGEGYPSWPTGVADIVQLYSDAPPARLRVLTPAAFTALKLIAWTDRRAPRDLYDLWALAESGWVTSDVAALYGRYGQHTTSRRIGRTPQSRAVKDRLACGLRRVLHPIWRRVRLLGRMAACSSLEFSLRMRPTHGLSGSSS